MPAYICDLCRMRFNRASSLTRHMRFHTDGRPPFQCFLCGRSFRRLSHLDRHFYNDRYFYNHRQRIPPVCERPYQCALCGSCYRQRRDLNRHMIDERPYQCILCGSRYHQRRNLNRHMQLSHNHRDDELTTRTQHTESLHGIISTVSTVNSSIGTAIVTTVQSATSLVATTTISQASGTFTHLDLARDPGNECPICFDSLNDRETITTPCCSKIFHIACLRTVDRTTPGREFPCPHCRRMLTREWLNGVILSTLCNYL